MDACGLMFVALNERLILTDIFRNNFNYRGAIIRFCSTVSNTSLLNISNVPLVFAYLMIQTKRIAKPKLMQIVGDILFTYITNMLWENFNDICLSSLYLSYHSEWILPFYVKWHLRVPRGSIKYCRGSMFLVEKKQHGNKAIKGDRRSASVLTVVT